MILPCFPAMEKLIVRLDSESSEPGKAIKVEMREPELEVSNTYQVSAPNT